jgi:dolichyl-phosphate-mannose-protein mannosyltransferase
MSLLGQQVTGYGHADENNWWQIIPTKALPETGRGRIVRHDDIIQLVHVTTDTYLLTHDVASPLMPTNQEVTTWARDDLSRYNDTLFHLYLNGAHEGEAVRSKSGYLRLVHVPTRVSLWSHREQLPDWAFKQQEINGDKNPMDRNAIWYVDEIISAEGEPSLFVPFVCLRLGGRWWRRVKQNPPASEKSQASRLLLKVL